MPRSNPPKPYLPLLWRLAVVACLAVAELWLQQSLGRDSAGNHPLSPFLKQVDSFLVAWAVSLVILCVIGRAQQSRPVVADLAGTAPRTGWWILHLALIVPVIWPVPFDLLAPGAGSWVWALQYPLGLIALLALLFAVIPLQTWQNLLRGNLPMVLLSAAMALLAVIAIRGMQDLWERAAAMTFALVVQLLQPFYPHLQALSDTRVLRAGTLAIYVDKTCSGLEGIGLMLVFCIGWLWYLRREFRFPAALLLIPAGVLVVYLLNAVRIAALFAIAASGHTQVALAGFHSQAGWIFFNATVFLTAIVSRNIAWLQVKTVDSRSQLQQPQREHALEASPTAAFLLPMLAILAAGMLTRAMSTGFDRLYWVRLPVALALLVYFRRSYRALDWRFSWHGPAAGVAVFAAWLLAARWLSPHAGMPATLAQLSTLERAWWIATRATVAVLIVPVVEELAFRGFLMRRLANADFEAVRFPDVRLMALLVSSVLFGLSHGAYWLPGMVAGLSFGAVAIRTGRFGEAVAAHTVANALLAATVLIFGSWQLW
jgi:exosortase E/protease (VPEID-CTERM system)